jgi:hypothetical protein
LGISLLVEFCCGVEHCCNKKVGSRKNLLNRTPFMLGTFDFPFPHPHSLDVSEDETHKKFSYQRFPLLSTHRLLLLPQLHGRFVFLKLVTPVGVDFLIVIAFVRRSASVGEIRVDFRGLKRLLSSSPMSIDIYDVATQQRATQVTIIASCIALVRRHDH